MMTIEEVAKPSCSSLQAMQEDGLAPVFSTLALTATLQNFG